MKKIYLIIGVVILIICLQQYIVYRSENKILLDSLSLAEASLARAEVIDSKFNQIQQESKLLENQIDKVKTIIPEKLEVEYFKKDFAKLASSIGVEVNYLNDEIKSYDLHNEAVLKISMSGEVSAVSKLLEKELLGERLIGGNNLSKEDDNLFQMELFLFSLNYSNGKIEANGLSESEFCSKVKSNIWLWNFKFRINKMKDKIHLICEKLKEYNMAVKSTAEIEERIKYIKKILPEFGKLLEYHDLNNKQILSNMHMQLNL